MENKTFSFLNDNRMFRFVEDLEDPETLEEFIETLDIPFIGEMKGEEYVVPMETSDDFSEVYNIISTNKNLHVQNDSTANDDEAKFTFKSENYEIELKANFNDDVYRLVVRVA